MALETNIPVDSQAFGELMTNMQKMMARMLILGIAINTVDTKQVMQMI